MREKIVDFWESRVIDSDFILGVILGLIFNIVIGVAVQAGVISWSAGTICMTIILSLVTLIIAPAINLGFIVSLYLLLFFFQPKENFEFLLIFIVLFFINFVSYKFKKIKEHV